MRDDLSSRERWIVGIVTMVVATIMSVIVKVVWFESVEDKLALRSGYKMSEIKYNSIMREDELINRMVDLTGRKIITFYAHQIRSGRTMEARTLNIVPIGSIDIVDRETKVINISNEYQINHWQLDEANFNIVDEALRSRDLMNLELIRYVQE